MPSTPAGLFSARSCGLAATWFTESMLEEISIFALSVLQADNLHLQGAHRCRASRIEIRSRGSNPSGSTCPPTPDRRRSRQEHDLGVVLLGLCRDLFGDTGSARVNDSGMYVEKGRADADRQIALATMASLMRTSPPITMVPVRSFTTTRATVSGVTVNVSKSREEGRRLDHVEDRVRDPDQDGAGVRAMAEPSNF